jgi:hypothetical protein
MALAKKKKSFHHQIWNYETLNNNILVIPRVRISKVYKDQSNFFHFWIYLF